jgi:hypothetical protein
MSQKGFSARTSDLSEYVARNGTLSDDLGGAGREHLAGHQSISATMFGDLGHESGLHGTLQGHLTRMHDHVHRLAGSVRDLGHAVDGARADYEANEELHADSYRRISTD